MNPIGPGEGWRIFGSTLGHRRGNEIVILWRKGQKCKWMTPEGRQVGPDQKNVAPALAWASQNGYVCNW